MPGKDLQAVFSDHELSDGVHFTHQFRRNGVLTGTDMGKSILGTWKINGQSLCYAWNRSSGENGCFEVKRRGNEVRLFQSGYELLSGTLARIHP